MAQRRRYDVFLSHSSANVAVARRVEKALERRGLAVWLDRSEIQPGVLLRDELQASIRASRLALLLWSAAAARSRWIAAELLTAFHEDRFVVPCVLDDTALPYFLDNAIFLDFRKRVPPDLAAQIARAPKGRNDVPAFRDSPNPETRAAIVALAAGQRKVTSALERRDTAKAAVHQKAIDAPQKAAERRWRLDATVLDLAGYHRKNAYVLKHGAAIDAGRPPKDPLLVRAERFFFDTLFVNPVDPSALNGLANVLYFERDYKAAEFFCLRALAECLRTGVDYPEARNDLALIRQHLTGA
jgi:TIR domain